MIEDEEEKNAAQKKKSQLIMIQRTRGRESKLLWA
jgi:hypothetical protein